MDTSHYLLLGGVALLLVLAVVNLAITIMDYRKEGYFTGGGPFGNTNSGTGAFGTPYNST
jgi:hypothetical protein